MKKLFLLVSMILLPLTAGAQWFGDGLTPATAFYGVVNSANPMTQWTLGHFPGGTVYVGRATSGQNDLEIANGGELDISQGVTVKFCSAASDLRITGTGILSAIGSGSAYVTFTRDAQASWGHISFENSTGASTLDHCIVEYGSKTGTTPAIEGYGGGLMAQTNNVTVTYCTFRNNYALFGGGIFVYANMSPPITNCQFYNNQSLHGGGGVYCWNGSGSAITNCLFESNKVLEPSTPYYTGGGLSGQSGVSLKVVNCTFVNNTSLRPEGQALLLHSSPNSKVVNCIFWGAPDKQIYLYGTTAATIIYSAYRGITYTTGAPVSSIVLNSSNTAADGPNFAATDGSDWSINFISPCRDKGTDSYTGVTVPSNDTRSYSRIYTTDMGAYEVQYSRWLTSPSDIYDWNSPLNWEQGVQPGASQATGDVIIPQLGGSSSAPEIGGTVYINSGKYMIIEPGGMATLSSLTNNGTLILQSDATNTASLITDSYSGNNSTVELYLSGGGSKTTYKWHFISSPVTSLAVSTFAPAYTLDLAQYVENRPSTSTREGWVAYDGYIYSTGGMGGPTFNSLSPGKGYDYWRSSDQKFTFSGRPNTSDVTVNLGFSGDSLIHGFNLLGNPFSSGLNWDDIVGSVYYTFPANTSQSLYYTRDNVQCTYASGVGTPADVTGIIPPMQGFFTKTYSAGNQIILPATSRTHDNIHARYKSLAIIPLIRLQLKEDSISDETVIRFNNNAKEGLDNVYDAIKFGVDPEMPAIYTMIGNKEFAINGQPFPQTDKTLELPINLSLTSDTSVHTISATQILGLSLYDVSLKDNVTGLWTDLKANPVYTFTSLKGSVKGRFIIRVSVSTGIHDINADEYLFNIYQQGSSLNLVPRSDLWNGKTGSIRILDLAGRVISEADNLEFSTDNPTTTWAPSVTGVYLVQVRSGALRYTGKIVIR